MCQPTNQLKLCTCATNEQRKVPATWEFHRFVEGKDHYIIGLMVGPPPISLEEDEANSTRLQARLNEPDAFDVDLNPQPNDRLVLCFRTNQGTYHYGYEFTENQWTAIDYDPFGWEQHHALAKKGCLEE
ncbi:MAG: hypothetical protein H6602_11065 [Flavobacteriales bacterium]|nr:hypothetical protein [Flavobacteriales bacterium]